MLFTWLLNSWKAYNVGCKSAVANEQDYFEVLRIAMSYVFLSTSRVCPWVCRDAGLEFRIASITVMIQTVRLEAQMSLSC